jgi:hypothetical protein
MENNLKENQLQALNNAANSIGLKVFEKFVQDKRKTITKYFVQNGINTISPVLDYNNCNMFLLGIIKCKEYAI